MTGSGTSEDPFIILNKADLQAIEDNLGSYYELGANIDASGTGEGFDPIILFTGQLDGKGFTITDLFINRPAESYVGLIGYTNASIVLKNISMTGVDITGSVDVGALLGYDNGGGTLDIDNCDSAGSVSAANGQVGGLIGLIKGGAVDDCWSSCTIVSDSSSQVGGLIGYCESAAITNCYATGSVTASGGSGSRAGGLIGDVWDAVITRCYATGNVSGIHSYIGGLIGKISQNPTITNCYARGNASVEVTAGMYAGGFAGNNHTGIIDDCYSIGAAIGESLVGGFCGEDYGTITNCFWDTEVSSNNTSDGGTGKTTAQMKTKTTFTDAGWDFTTPIWYIGTNSYPTLGAPISYFPSDAVARVSSIRHIFRPGFFRMQVALGDLGFDVDIAETTVRKALDTATEAEEGVPEAVEPTPTSTDASVTELTTAPLPTGQTELFNRAAAIRAEIIRLSRALQATGLTKYARSVLENRIKELQTELNRVYAAMGLGSVSW